MDADVWSIAPYTEADLQEQVDKADDFYGAEGAAAPAGPRRLRRRASTSSSRRPAPIRTKMPFEYGAIGKTARGLDRHGRDRDRVAGRRHLRQGRRRRARSRGRARGGQGPLRRRRRRAGVAGLPPPRRPGGADHREGGQRLVRLSDLARHRQASRCPTRARSWTRRTTAARLLGAASAALLGGVGGLGGMSNALLVSGAESESGPPGRRDGPAGRVLHAADPRRDGPARARHRRPGRGLPRHQPVRAAGPRAGLRVVGDLGRAGHHRHLRREAVRARRVGAGRAVHPLPLQGRVPRDGDPHPREQHHAQPRRPVPARDVHAGGAAHGARHRQQARHRRRPAGGVREAALHLLPRGGLGARVLGPEPPVEGPERRGLPAGRCTRSTSRSTGSTPTTATSPTSTPATTRCAPPAPTPTSRTGARASTTGRAGRRTSRRPTSRPSRSTRR